MISIAVMLAFLQVAAPQKAAKREPTFRAETRLVEVNVLVHDKSGPVSNLVKDDFVLTDRGQRQTIAVFSVESRERNGRVTRTLPANTFSNDDTSTPRGVSILLLDGLNTFRSVAAEPYEEGSPWAESQALAYAKQQVLRFIRELDPKDRVAIYSLAQTLSVLCDFTSDRSQLQAILMRYQPISITDRETAKPGGFHSPVPGDFNQTVDQDRQRLAGIANGNRAEATVAALLSIAAHVEHIPGRKSLVWVTANVPFSVVGAARALSAANIAVYPVDARGLLPRANSATREWAPGGQDAMAKLAQETGGRAFFNTNDISGAIHQAVEDSDVSYVLGFYPASGSLDGTFHALQVRVKRRGLDVRYSRGYFARKEKPVSKQQNESGVLNAIESPLESPAIPLIAQVTRVNRPKPNLLSVMCSLDVRNLQSAALGDPRRAIQVYFVQQDAGGKVLEKTAYWFDLHLTKERISFRQYVEPKSGATTLRVLVDDRGAAAIGSLIIPLPEVK